MEAVKHASTINESGECCFNEELPGRRSDWLTAVGLNQ